MKKRIIINFVFLSAIIAAFISCDKDGSSDSNKLEGKWWKAEKFEARFNGEIVKTYPTLDKAEWAFDRVIFENGTVTIEFDGVKESYAYGFHGDELTIWGITLDVVKLTNKELVGDWVFGEEIDEEDISDGRIIGQYRGKDIYRSSDWWLLWYYDSKGNPVECYYKDSYYYDTERYYLRAE